MKSNVLVRFVMVWWIAFAMIVVSTTIVYGMNKADLVEKMAGEAGISKVADESAVVAAVNQGTWLNHPPIISDATASPNAVAATWSALPPYNVLWPLWSPVLSPADAAVYMEAPLLTDTSLVPLMIVPDVNGIGVVIIMEPSMLGMDGFVFDDAWGTICDVKPWWSY